MPADTFIEVVMKNDKAYAELIKKPEPPAVTKEHQLEWSNTLLERKRVKRTDAEAAVAAMGEGWRMPTVDELQTILDRSRHSPTADTEKFPDTQSAPYWTSTLCSWDSDARWVVDFNYGIVDDYYVNNRACVRACRAASEVGNG